MVHERVESAEAMRASLAAHVWDLVISDFSLPGFGGPQALEVLRASGHEIPFIAVSGSIGEESAVGLLQAGAADFLLKDRLGRLGHVVDRALKEAAERRARQRAEAAVRASEERLRAMMESMGDVVFTTDAELRHTRVFGIRPTSPPRDPTSLLARTPRELWDESTATAHEAAMRRALAGDKAMLEWTLETDEGPRHFQTAFTPLTSESGAIEGVVGTERDVTRQRELQAQLLAADRLASVGMLAAGVAHELNNPLSAVVANLELAAREVERSGADEESQRRVLSELADAREAAARLRGIVRDISLLSRPQSEETEDVELAPILASSIRIAAIETRHAAPVISAFQPLPLVRGNASRLGQLFLNLLVNAAQAIPAGHASENEIRVSAFVGGEATGTPVGAAVVEVSDTGAGMSEETQRRIFAPFFSTKPFGRGTGLGLSICQRIVSSLGGELSVRSTLGRGSTFRVVLPPAPPRAPAPVAPLPAAPPPPPPLALKRRILLIDDERLILTMLQRVLSADYEVTSCSRAAEGLERIRRGERFDLILCDVMMPDMNGMEFHAHLLKEAESQAMRTLFVTGGAFDPETQAFLERVGNARIEKPFDVETLRTLVRERLLGFPESPT